MCPRFGHARMQYTLPIRRVHKRHACRSSYIPDRRLPYASRRVSSGECRILFPHLSGQAVFCPASRGHPPFSPARRYGRLGKELVVTAPATAAANQKAKQSQNGPFCANFLERMNFAINSNIGFVHQEHFFPVPKDAAVADSKTFTDFSDAQTAHSEFKNFPAARCQSNSRYTRLRFLIEVMQQLNVAMNAEGFSNCCQMPIYRSHLDGEIPCNNF